MTLDVDYCDAGRVIILDQVVVDETNGNSLEENYGHSRREEHGNYQETPRERILEAQQPGAEVTIVTENNSQNCNMNVCNKLCNIAKITFGLLCLFLPSIISLTVGIAFNSHIIIVVGLVAFTITIFAVFLFFYKGYQHLKKKQIYRNSFTSRHVSTTRTEPNAISTIRIYSSEDLHQQNCRLHLPHEIIPTNFQNYHTATSQMHHHFDKPDEPPSYQEILSYSGATETILFPPSYEDVIGARTSIASN